MRTTFTCSWTRPETIQTRVDLVSDDPLEGDIFDPPLPHSSRGITQLPRLLTATTPSITDDGR